jgi:hypothetical protein
MSFANPLFLFALVLLLVPILIHLFHFRITKKVSFPDIRFLKKVEKASKSQRNLYKRLVLFSRILALLFLVLGFAQPMLLEDDRLSLGNRVTIYIDNSLSMSRPLFGNNSAAAVAVESAKNIISEYQENARVRVKFIGEGSSSSLYKSPKTWMENLDNYDLKTSSQPFDIKLALANEGGVNEEDVYLISDFQKGGMTQFEEGFFDSLFRYYFVPVGDFSSSNLYVDSLWLNEYFPYKGVTSLSVEVRNSGNETRDFSLNLISENNIRSTASAEVNANQSVVLSFDLVIDSGGFSGFIRIDDRQVLFDNQFYFCINPFKSRKVIEITPGNKSPEFEKVFFNNALFKYETNNADRLEALDVNTYDLIILNGVSLNQEFLPVWNLLLREDISFVYIPNDNPEIIGYKELTTDFPDMIQKEDYMNTNLSNRNHPLLSDVFDETLNPNEMELPVFRAPLLKPVSGETILMNQNRQPVFSRLSGTHGYVFGTPLSKEWTNIFRHALLIPMMYKLAFEHSKVSELYYRISNEPIVLNDLGTETGSIKLISNEIEYFPNQWVRENNRIIQVDASIFESGIYEVWTEDTFRENIALNLDKRESEFSFFANEALVNQAANLENLTVLERQAQIALDTTREAGLNSIPFWKYCLLLSLLFLLFEILLIRFYK